MMPTTWYPVIDYSSCTECGTCIADCPYDVYGTTKAPIPVVKNPEACIDHCHGCGDRCPAGAITYVGDDSGWTPPNFTEEPSKPGCSCDGADCGSRKVLVEYLYLDLQSCDRCIGTDSVLEDVLRTLTPVLQLAGYEVEYNKVQMESAEIAKQYRFLSSPTIRVNGQDICQSVAENSCGCCSDMSGTDVDCRVFEYEGGRYEVPPKEMIAEAILKAVFGQSRAAVCCDAYELPENLEAFYEGKQAKAGCSCDGSCC